MKSKENIIQNHKLNKKRQVLQENKLKNKWLMIINYNKGKTKIMEAIMDLLQNLKIKEVMALLIKN